MSNSFGKPTSTSVLPPAPSIAQKSGPLHQVEFVVEIVGPNSAPASAVAALLTPAWQGPLGSPRVWVMAPQDLAWRPLTTATDGSYDSIVLTWPYMNGDTHLTSRSAITLAGTAERFASGLQRRALTMPPPNDVDKAVRAVREVVDRLDIGVSVSVEFENAVPEEHLWRTAVDLGLSLNGSGEFVWGNPAQSTVVPLQMPLHFTLGGVKSGRAHEGITVGFCAPLSVSPSASLKASLYVADEYARRHGGFVFAEGGSLMTPQMRAEYDRNLQAAVAAFNQVGLVSGSAEAIRLFGG